MSQASQAIQAASAGAAGASTGQPQNFAADAPADQKFDQAQVPTETRAIDPNSPETVALNDRFARGASKGDFVAPPSFVSDSSRSSTPSFDAMLAHFVAPSSQKSPDIGIHFPPKNDEPATKVSTKVQDAIDAFKEVADRSAALALTTSLIGATNSSFKRLTQGQ